MSESLHFAMALPKTPRDNLIAGVLTYCKNEKPALTFRATSGCIGNQYVGCQSRKGKGAIPSCKQVGIYSYSVSTQKLWLPHVKGVEGSFFPISPFSVNVNGVARGDFGIHFDANVPGSVGCIVLPLQADWTNFLETMKDLHEQRIKSIPLHVSYT